MSREKMPVRKNGARGKPGVLDLWCTVFFPIGEKPELASIGEVYYGDGVYPAEQSGGTDAASSVSS